jgi:hypothetical protein
MQVARQCGFRYCGQGEAARNSQARGPAADALMNHDRFDLA